ncbi:hypothetical protein [Streptomyces sp. NPDC055912]
MTSSIAAPLLSAAQDSDQTDDPQIEQPLRRVQQTTQRGGSK